MKAGSTRSRRRAATAASTPSAAIDLTSQLISRSQRLRHFDVAGEHKYDRFEWDWAGLWSRSRRRVLGNEPLLSVLSAERPRIMGEIQSQVNTEARQFGIEVLDVRIRRADLPEENTQAILSRMQSERERVAREARAEGAARRGAGAIRHPARPG